MENHIYLLETPWDGVDWVGRSPLWMLLGETEPDPGSQQTPLVPPQSGRGSVLHGRWTHHPGLSATGVATASCVTFSPAGPGRGAELPGTCSEGCARVQVAQLRSGTDSPPALVSGADVRGQESSRRRTGRLSSLDAVCPGVPLTGRVQPLGCSLLWSCWKNVLT